MADSGKTLDAARRDIDEIDDALHDLLMRRADAVERIRAAKETTRGAAIRPAREAEILRRLLARHRGPFPPASLVSIWREIFAAVTMLQGPFAVAVYAGEDGPLLRPLARAHFGHHTLITNYGRPGQIFAALREEATTVGVLPLPEEGDAQPWWRYLLSEDADRVRIVARLPFVRGVGGDDGDIEALVVARVAFEPSDEDRSFLVFQSGEHISRGRLQTALAEQDLVQRFYSAWRDEQHPSAWFHLVEVEGHVDERHPGLRRLLPVVTPAIDAVYAIGGYALPLDLESLVGKAGARR